MPNLASPHAPSPLAFVLRRARGVIESEIRGGSMGATLPPGTRIRIACGVEAHRSIGSVVAFEGNDGLVGHRVVGHVTDHRGRVLILARGDGMLVCDPPLDPERVLGEIAAFQRGAEWLPLPPAPAARAGTRAGRSVALAMVRGATRIHPTLAAHLAEGLQAAAYVFLRHR